MSKRLPTRQKCRNKKISDDLSIELKKRLDLLVPDVKSEYLRDQVLSKFVSTDTDSALIRQTRAINKWLATERENEATNERILTTHPGYHILPRVTFSVFVQWCQSRIASILGDTVPVEALIGSFSGGASTSRNRTESHPANKYLGRAHVTERCLEVFSELSDEMPGWLSWNDLTFEVVPGNVMFTVPKKTDIDRVACKEPDVNMFVQKGIGDYIRRSLLKKAKINLNDQSINRSLARIGSIDGSLATLDLSSASDSISWNLVQLLLPETWFTFLDAVRSPVTILPDGETHRNEMFSSMGNGFTFELESLLFYVLTRATCYFRGISGIVSVYGDDIICPSEVNNDLEWVLGYFGFSVNTEKSYAEGPFRESCGGHYYNGIDITPFYIKKPITHLIDVIDAANKLRKWAEFSPESIILDPQVEEIWLWLKSHVPDVLWGGSDTSFKYQLVSDDENHSRLVETTKKGDVGLGGYYHWLNTTWRRDSLSDAVSTSQKTNTRGTFRFRKLRASTVPRLTHYFYHEAVKSRVSSSVRS